MVYKGVDVDHKAFTACSILVDAYADGAANGGSVTWAAVDDAHVVVKEALDMDPEEDDSDA